MFSFHECNGFLKKEKKKIGYIFPFISWSIFIFLSMEGREGISSSGVTVVGSDAPSDYHVAPRTTENPTQVSGSTPVAMAALAVTPLPATAAGDIVPVAVKKKRGRPRKYVPDGSVNSVALSPKPISSSVPPPVIDFSSEKRGKVRTTGSAGKHHQPRMELESVGKDAIATLYIYIYANRIILFLSFSF